MVLYADGPVTTLVGLRLAAEHRRVSPWLRPGRGYLPGSVVLPCIRARKGPGADGSRLALLFVAVLEPGRTSWTALLDATRLGPCDDVTTVTATQLGEVVQRLQQAGQHKPRDANILIVFDAGYDVTRLAFLLADLPVEVLGRLRSDRVFLLR